MSRRLTLSVLSLALMTTPLLAQGRPDARKMTCEQVQTLIEERGAAVITTGQHTYERFIGGRRGCEMPYVEQQTRIKTRDTNQCVVYSCVHDGGDDMGWRRL